MFEFLRKSFKLAAPITGTVINLSEVPDEVFAKKMAGDGFAINATGDKVVAPADGEISIVFRTNHAFGMTLDSGIQILVHIGLDTIGLEGAGFKCVVEEGQKVKMGDPVIELDRGLILDRRYSLITPVIITDIELIKSTELKLGINAEAGKDIVLEYKIK